jgi:hypothetical protein
VSFLSAPGFSEQAVRRRAREGAAALFPPPEEYGTKVYGADPQAAGDAIDTLRLAPPLFMPGRLAKLIDLGREPLYTDVELAADFGGMTAPLPVYVSALGSTRVASASVGLSRQAGRLGVPMVIGENVAPMNGFRSAGDDHRKGLLDRIHAYLEELPDGLGGICVQQSTEDANHEVWNQVYSDPAVGGLLATGRLAFELKVGQGAKPGLGGLTLIAEETAAGLDGQYAIERLAEPNTATAGPISASVSKPATNSEVILSTRHGSWCSQPVSPSSSSSRWSVVLSSASGIWLRRSSTGPRKRSFTCLRCSPFAGLARWFS